MGQSVEPNQGNCHDRFLQRRPRRPDFDEKMDTYNTYVDMVAGAEHDVAALIAILKEAEVNEMLEETIGDIHCSIGGSPVAAGRRRG